MARVEFDRWAACMNFDNLFKLSRLVNHWVLFTREPRVQAHLKNVYSCLFIALLAAAAGAYVSIALGLMQAGIFAFLGNLALMAWLVSVPHEAKNVAKRIGILAGLGACTGISLGPMLQIAVHVDPSIIPTAFLGACVIFGSFSLTALFSRDRTWLYLGGTLFSVLSWMLIGSLLNIFFRSQLIFQAQLYIGLLVFCGFVLYDTQLIIEKKRRGDDDYIWQSVDLFLDFIQIFQRLIIILTQKEADKKKNRK